MHTQDLMGISGTIYTELQSAEGGLNTLKTTLKLSTGTESDSRRHLVITPTVIKGFGQQKATVEKKIEEEEQCKILHMQQQMVERELRRWAFTQAPKQLLFRLPALPAPHSNTHSRSAEKACPPDYQHHSPSTPPSHLIFLNPSKSTRCAGGSTPSGRRSSPACRPPPASPFTPAHPPPTPPPPTPATPATHPSVRPPHPPTHPPWRCRGSGSADGWGVGAVWVRQGWSGRTGARPARPPPSPPPPPAPPAAPAPTRRDPAAGPPRRGAAAAGSGRAAARAGAGGRGRTRRRWSGCGS